MSWLIDTNVLCELRRKRPEANVIAWFEDHDESPMFVSVITMGEIRGGIEEKRLKDPDQATAIERWFVKLQLQFASRILPVTDAVADEWGRLSPDQPLPDCDGLVAATGLVHGLTVVTRNVADFRRSGVKLLNPWDWHR